MYLPVCWLYVSEVSVYLCISLCVAYADLCAYRCLLCCTQRACDISADGLYFATACNGFNDNGCETKVWDVRMLQVLVECTGHRQSTLSCAFVGDILLASASQDETIRLYERSTGQCVHTTTLKRQGGFTSLTWSPAAREHGSLFSCTFQGGLQQWDVTNMDLSLVAACQPFAENPDEAG